MAEKRPADEAGDPEELVEIPEYYTNSVGFTVSIYEFLLAFGVKNEQKSPARPLVRIRMSPQHAKVMAALFSRNVEAYEQKVGPIRLPQQLVKELRLDEGTGTP